MVPIPQITYQQASAYVREQYKGIVTSEPRLHEMILKRMAHENSKVCCLNCKYLKNKCGYRNKPAGVDKDGNIVTRLPLEALHGCKDFGSVNLTS